MNEVMTDILAGLRRKKGIGVILFAVVLGVMLCLIAPSQSKSVESTARCEKKIAQLCLAAVGSEPYVSVNRDTDGTVIGVVVVLERGDEPTARLRVTEMISTLYSIPSSHVYVTGTSSP